MAGTIRGSVAFALILTIEAHDDHEVANVSVIKSTILFMVFLTTITLGGIMPTFISFCIKRDQKSKKEVNDMPIKAITDELLKE